MLRMFAGETRGVLLLLRGHPGLGENWLFPRDTVFRVQGEEKAVGSGKEIRNGNKIISSGGAVNMQLDL